MQVLRRAGKDTLEIFSTTRKSIICAVCLLVVGFVLAYLCVGKERAFEELHKSTLYTLAPIGIVAAIVFLWQLWMAPFKLIDEKLDKFYDTPLSAKAQSPDYGAWKHTTTLMLYQVAELCGGVSPGDKPTRGSNDRARASDSELLVALRRGNLESVAPFSNVAAENTQIRRTELQKYFAGREDYPEFLRD